MVESAYCRHEGFFLDLEGCELDLRLDLEGRCVDRHSTCIISFNAALSDSIFYFWLVYPVYLCYHIPVKYPDLNPCRLRILDTMAVIQSIDGSFDIIVKY